MECLESGIRLQGSPRFYRKLKVWDSSTGLVNWEDPEQDINIEVS